MQKSWIDDFEKKYNKPTIEPITVGFSGIDPNPKYTDSSGEAIAEEVLEKLKELEIRIDSGSIDPDTPEPTPTPSPAPIIQTQNDHEKLKNLLGGNDDGHYHVTHDELAKLQNLPERVTDGKAATIKIGTVTTGAEGTKVSVINRGTENAAVLDFVIPRGERGIDGATGAKGSKGDPFTYEDFTPAQLAALKGEKGDTGATGAKGAKGDPFRYEDFTPAQLAALKGEKGDKGDTGAKGVKGDPFKYEDFTAEQLAGLKGEKGDKGDPGAVGAKGIQGDKGDPFVYDDFTPEQLEALKGAKGDKGDPFRYEDFTPEQLETLKVGGGVSNHEELTNLQGGTDNEHYHMEEAQHHKLEILIKALFPTGTDDIYIPYIDDRDPDNPKVLPYTPFVDLPKGNPPEWQQVDFPSGYTAYSGVHKMYYGKITTSRYSSGGSISSTEEYLFLAMSKSNDTATGTTVWTNNLTSWTVVPNFSSLVANNPTGNHYRDFLIIQNGSSDYLYFTNGQGVNIYQYNSSNRAMQVATVISSNTINDCNSICYSKELGILLAVGKTKVVKVMNKTGLPVINSTHTVITMPDNFQSLDVAWSPVHQIFCVCGETGTATSADGENWVLHNDAPKNLIDLTYREDLEVFFARSLDDKLFYASGDGITWKNVTVTPIPLDTVACVDFCKETGIYCAVGGTSEFAYFSKDLTTWVPTKITNGANIEAGSVIYMPSTKKYVLFPTSGSYYYTFDPSEWID